MTWLRPKPSKKAIIFLSALAVGLVAATTGIFLQQQAAYARASAVLEQKEQEREEGKRLATKLVGSQEALQRDRQRLRFLEAGVPRAAYVPTLLRQIERMATNTQNRVLGIRPELEKPKRVTKQQRRRDPEADEKAAKNPVVEQPENAPYDRLRIQLNLRGSYASTQRFMQELTKFPKIMAVEGMSLRPRPSQDGAPGPGLSADLTVVAFIWKGGPLPQAPARTPASLPGGAEEA
jgi:Tfp pilus assembly protein PilO